MSSSPLDPRNHPENQPEPRDPDALPEDPLEREISLQAKMQAYRNALQQEYEVAENESRSAALTTQHFHKDHLPEYNAQIYYLAMNADSESVRLSATKYGIDRALIEEDALKGQNDPVTELIKSMQKASTPISESTIADGIKSLAEEEMER